MSEMRQTGAQALGRAQWRGTRGRQAIAGVGGLLAGWAEGVTSLVHALLVWGWVRQDDRICRIDMILILFIR